MRILSCLLRTLESMFFQEACVLCRKRISASLGVCTGCLDELKKNPGQERIIKLHAGNAEKTIRAYTCVPYAGNVKELIYSFKFTGKKRIARAGAVLLYHRLISSCLDSEGKYCLVPVPLFGAREKERGYNQSSLLAHELSLLSGFEVAELLERIRDTGTQVGLGEEERKRNVEGAFRVKSEAFSRRIVLIDDIITTGATFGECARVLFCAGAKDVCGLFLAGTVIDI